ncbi:sensor histidine kinase [Noviherbaspirillum galbum]|uniref:histidine kinase n=1 Tax=Noviherbaspirillum galbum TaxID=2709383 RepID=A0A6B3SG59_9BURK|nr:sensor histidine kinase [Noviherbaspirillum galbum]NEX59628.1 hypothetical protein [Noviherbaspirillum galbum]
MAGIAIVILSIWLNLSALDTLVANQRAQGAQRSVAAQLQNLVSLALQAETGQRGYVITGKEEYLAPYRDAVERLPAAFASLRNSLEGDAGQLRRLSQVEALQGKKQDELGRSIAVRRDQGFAEAQAIVSSDVGREYMQQVRDLVAAIDGIERGKLVERMAASARSAEQARRSIVFAGALDVFLIGALFLFTRHDLRMREKAAAERSRSDAMLRELNQSLERRIVERTQELQTVNERLDEVNRELEAFSYSVAHDLRAPLRSMHGFAEAVKDDYAGRLDEEGQDYLRRIADAAARMESLIDDLLVFSNLSRGELPMQPVAVDDMVHAALVNLEADVRASGADIRLDLEALRVMGNRQACVQACQNLLSNAIKFVAPGERPSVFIRCEQTVDGDGGPAVRVLVKDNGIGIRPDRLDRIFRPFERLHGVDEFRGSGIGLAIVETAVRRMYGQCGVESRVGQGSLFWFVLPGAA